MNLIKRAKMLGFSCCPCCQKVNPATEEKQTCTRCNYTFHQRKPNSIQFTFAWAIAASIMFLPANLYPMMTFYKLGIPDSNTIFGGLLVLMDMGLYPIAGIIFVASFIIPLGKIIGLFILLYNTRKHSKISRIKQGKLYHMVEWLGPWSMLDVFVVAVMAAVVKLGFISSIEAGLGLTFFTLTVIFTMFAANSFDPRLLWDIERRNIHVKQ